MKRSNVITVWLKVFLITVCILSSCQLNRNRQLSVPPIFTQGTDLSRSITINGHERTYVVHIPPEFDNSSVHPLVIVLHGGGGDAQNAIRMTRMSEKSNQENFVTAYPNGTGRIPDRFLTWNSGNCCGYALDHSVDDGTFIRAMINQIHTEFNIDLQRVYATGISNGGMMVYRLACEMADVFAAIAPVSGALNFEPCQPSDAVALIIFHGTADQHVLYEGGKPLKQLDNHERVDTSVAYAVSFWASNNGCFPQPETEQQGNIIRESYVVNCKENRGVILYAIVGGGHAWPGGGKGTSWGDEPTQEISATEFMWNFFKQHPKSSP